MTQQGFEDYLFAAFGKKSGTASSYITAIRIIDEMFGYEDVFRLKGTPLTSIEDVTLLVQIEEFIIEQQAFFRKGTKSFFDNISKGKNSYPTKSFCSAAMKQLVKYKNDIYDNKANELISDIISGEKVSKKLVSFFEIDKEGNDFQVATRARMGQNYFRKMVLANYGNRCCVTGLNIPQTLRASHIVAWAKDKKNRMNPENGLCLSATYDAAFDKHLISFDDDYRMIVSKEIKDYYTNNTTKEYFGKFEGKKILLPEMFKPSKELLEKHRELLAM